MRRVLRADANCSAHDDGERQMKPFEIIAALFIGAFVYLMFVVLLSF